MKLQHDSSDHCHTETATVWTELLVPSCEYRDFTEALTEIQHKSGNFLIKLKNGTHYMDIDFDRSQVNGLKIVGDPSPVKGLFYEQNGGQMMVAESQFINEYNYQVGGLGTWNLTVVNNLITVSGNSGQNNPDFSVLTRDDVVVFRHANGSYTRHIVCSAKDNTITLYDSPLLLGETLLGGMGFFVEPLAKVTSSVPRRLYVLDRLVWSGVVFDLPFPSYQGALQGTSQIGQSVISGGYFQVGYADNVYPNVVTGTYSVTAAARGLTQNQTRMNLVQTALPPKPVCTHKRCNNRCGCSRSCHCKKH